MARLTPSGAANGRTVGINQPPPMRSMTRRSSNSREHQQRQQNSQQQQQQQHEQQQPSQQQQQRCSTPSAGRINVQRVAFTDEEKLTLTNIVISQPEYPEFHKVDGWWQRIHSLFHKSVKSIHPWTPDQLKNCWKNNGRAIAMKLSSSSKGSNSNSSNKGTLRRASIDSRGSISSVTSGSENGVGVKNSPPPASDTPPVRSSSRPRRPKPPSDSDWAVNLSSPSSQPQSSEKVQPLKFTKVKPPASPEEPKPVYGYMIKVEPNSSGYCPKSNINNLNGVTLDLIRRQIIGISPDQGSTNNDGHINNQGSNQPNSSRTQLTDASSSTRRPGQSNVIQIRDVQMQQHDSQPNEDDEQMEDIQESSTLSPKDQCFDSPSIVEIDEAEFESIQIGKIHPKSEIKSTRSTHRSSATEINVFGPMQDGHPNNKTEPAAGSAKRSKSSKDCRTNKAKIIRKLAGPDNWLIRVTL